MENSERGGNTRPPDLPLEKTCMQVRKQQLELDMEQQTGSKLGKEYIKAVCCHPAYLTSMQSTSCKVPGWMTHKLDESRLPGEISTTSDMQISQEAGQVVWYSYVLKNFLQFVVIHTKALA